MTQEITQVPVPEANGTSTSSSAPSETTPIVEQVLPEPTPIEQAPRRHGPRMPKTIQWMDMPPPYNEMRIRVWVNFPNELAQDIVSGDKDKVQAAVKQIFIEHNDWEDYNGEPLPSTQEKEFWDKIPNELAATMVTLLDIEGKRLPNLVRQNAER